MIQEDGQHTPGPAAAWPTDSDDYLQAMVYGAVRPQPKNYLRAAEAAAILHVSPKTISRWAREGKINHVVTLGGHRRFIRGDIEVLAERLVVGNEPAH
jgi:excisionase family DNA binding protein